MRIDLSSAGVAYNCIVFPGLRFLKLTRLEQLSGLYGGGHTKDRHSANDSPSPSFGRGHN